MTSDISTSPAPAPDAASPAPDPFLAILVRTAEAGMEFAVTLHVSGTLVSGVMISTARYCEEIADAFSTGAPGHKPIAAGFFELAAELPKPGVGEVSGFMDQLLPPEFIHLTKVRVHAPGSMASQHPLMTWRGRLDHVSGWSMGMLAPAD
jgi:hypothetical protein